VDLEFGVVGHVEVDDVLHVVVVQAAGGDVGGEQNFGFARLEQTDVDVLEVGVHLAVQFDVRYLVGGLEFVVLFEELAELLHVVFGREEHDGLVLVARTGLQQFAEQQLLVGLLALDGHVQQVGVQLELLVELDHDRVGQPHLEEVSQCRRHCRTEQHRLPPVQWTFTLFDYFLHLRQESFLNQAVSFVEH